jgi:hypothetical protein
MVSREGGFPCVFELLYRRHLNGRTEENRENLSRNIR